MQLVQQHGVDNQHQARGGLEGVPPPTLPHTPSLQAREGVQGHSQGQGGPPSRGRYSTTTTTADPGGEKMGR